LRLETRVPYVWSQGTEDAFTVNLIEMTAEDGTVGYGETTAAPDADAQKIILNKLARSYRQGGTLRPLAGTVFSITSPGIYAVVANGFKPDSSPVSEQYCYLR